jgi:dTDP-3-amino-3,4,6-trideoxy-alpha-D-glucose transaminase
VTVAASPAVPFLDFAGHVAALRPELEAAIARVLDSGHFILGPEGEGFEQELARATESNHAVAVANGTDAIELALRLRGIGPGDEVVTSPLTAAFTVLGVLATGARPVFADLDPSTLNLSPEAVAKAVGPRTKVLLPVHLYGNPADLDPLRALAKERALSLVEDACQAVGARYKGRVVGTGGLGALSFYPTKNLGALGDGGAVLLEDPAEAARLRELRNGGQGATKYRHEVVGVNSRLDDLQAAILRVGLRHLAAWTERRRGLAALYDRELASLPLGLPREQPGGRSVYHLYVVRHPRRDALRAALLARGIGTLVHYPIPLHRQPAFQGLFGGGPTFPVAERAAAEVLSLPLHPTMTDVQALAVVAALRAALEAIA